MKLPSGLRRRVSRKISNQNEKLKVKTMQTLALIKNSQLEIITMPKDNV